MPADLSLDEIKAAITEAAASLAGGGVPIDELPPLLRPAEPRHEPPPVPRHPGAEAGGEQDEPSAPVAPEGEAEAIRYLERLIESAAPPPTRPLYGDLIGLCTQVDSLLCWVREQGKARIATLEAENAALREVFDAACAMDGFGMFDDLESPSGVRMRKATRRARALLQGGADA